MTRSRAGLWAILMVVAVSTPLALGMETVLRGIMFPPEFDQVRGWLRPTLTPWAWAMAPLALVATFVGFALLRWLHRRELARARPWLDAQQQRARADLESLLLSTSAPQLPALAGTFLFMFGADIVPVAVTMAVATAGVLALGLAVPRHTAPPPDPQAVPQADQRAK